MKITVVSRMNPSATNRRNIPGEHGPVSVKNMSSYQYVNSDYKDKTVSRPFYLYTKNSHARKTLFIMRQYAGRPSLYELILYVAESAGAIIWGRCKKKCIGYSL